MFAAIASRSGRNLGSIGRQLGGRISSLAADCRAVPGLRAYLSSGNSKKHDSDCDCDSDSAKMTTSKETLREQLTPMQYHVTQEAGTERPFTGIYNKCYDKGRYQCIVCHEDLFTSDTKYDSGCGWPAFNDVLDKGKVTLHKDTSIAERVRTEVRCAKCGAHMGHVFEDGPPPTRKRYCINSASIDFIPAGGKCAE